MPVWYEWRPDAEDAQDGPHLWCAGWSVDREPLRVAIQRYGWDEIADPGLSPWRLAQDADLREAWIFYEEDAGEWCECDHSETGAIPATLAFLRLSCE
jgi:hypothetical protein